MDITTRTETLSVGDQSWLASEHGTDNGRPVTLDKSSFTSGTHYPDGYFKSGIPLALITATNKYGPYDDTQAPGDGRGVLVGLLFDSPSVPSDDVDPVGVMLEHCIVRESKLPVAINANGKADVAGRIIFRP